jgi:chemotaxis protein methyltransferase CheR
MSSQTTSIEIHPENYRFLQEHVYAQSGIVLDHDKHYLFENRLAPIVRQYGLDSINGLCALLAKSRDTEVGRQVVEAMTTNETYFYREPAQYNAIRSVLFPQLKQIRGDLKKVRFWSAAASTGQEIYSLSMALLENGFTDWNMHLLGTDFSAKVLERARLGRYQQIEVNRGLPAALLVKYFRRTGMDWQLNDAVRQMVKFETIDLRKSMRAMGPFDLVFCRNVMIYFDAETKKNILRELHGTLFRGGWLLLGGAESATGVDSLFETKLIEGSTIYVAK